MKYFLGLVAVADILIVGGMMAFSPAAKADDLFLAYPPPEHETTAEKIFFIGSAAPEDKVLINGKAIERSPAGHFAPSLPLKIGANTFTIRHQDEEIELVVTRKTTTPEIPEQAAFAPDSLTPAVDLARLPNELICFGAVAPPDTDVAVHVGRSKILLLPQVESTELPANSAVLTSDNQPINSEALGKYTGCTALDIAMNYGKPIFELRTDTEIVTQQGAGEIKILSPQDMRVVEVTADAGVTRTGASTDHSRLTPLPKGTRAMVTGKEGEWLRLDYGAWIKAEETQPIVGNVPPKSIVRSVNYQQLDNATEIVFPLQTRVPITIKQGEQNITLSLHNTTAQTDTIRLDEDPVIKRLDWQQVSPTQIDYTFQLKQQQQWGYDLRYEDTSLILSLRHPPESLQSNTSDFLSSQKLADSSKKSDLLNTLSTQSLAGIRILLDPGHGGKESGSVGPNGYPEKDINLLISQLIETELKHLGAEVYLTRTKDKDVSLKKRMEMIDEIKPDLALSIHYNALPDNGDAINTKGISTFWYHPQAHDLAVFLHNYLVKNLNRESAGVFWNNLALTRPHTAPSVLLELGYMINPEEFEWITNSVEQRKLAKAIALGIKEWLETINNL